MNNNESDLVLRECYDELKGIVGLMASRLAGIEHGDEGMLEHQPPMAWSELRWGGSVDRPG